MKPISCRLHFLLIAILVPLAAVGLDTSIVSGLCNTKMIPPGSSFWPNLGDTIADLEANTATNGYNYSTQRSGGGTTCYGLATCKSGTTQPNCAKCLKFLGDNIWSICNIAMGAQVQLQDCFMRYEAYSFKWFVAILRSKACFPWRFVLHKSWKFGVSHVYIAMALRISWRCEYLSV